MPAVADSPDEQLTELAAALSEAVADLGDELTRPLVLVGSDLSAAGISALAAGQGDPAPSWWPDALVLAAIPAYGEHASATDWESELAVRTHCPVHRETLTKDTGVSRGTLSAGVSEALLDLAYANGAALPQLLLIGDSDPITDHAAVTRLAQSLPAARLLVVRGGHHDVLNDVQHRSVAAEVVSFLETLRDGQPLLPVITVASSDW
jgi:pimeloyl-ACP methyl ester carboxylesterase